MYVRDPAFKDSKLIENQIKQLVEDIASEVSGNVAFIDVEFLRDVIGEIDELQQQLWKIESGV